MNIDLIGGFAALCWRNKKASLKIMDCGIFFAWDINVNAYII
ncbi:MULTISPECIES: hypothetical protein [unclassified Bilifractor]